MNVTELMITGFDGPAMVFATTLKADEAKVIKPAVDEEGETVVGERWERATDAFAVIRDLMNDIVDIPAASSS